MPSASFSTRQRRRRLIARHHLGRTAAGVVEATRGVVAVHSSDPCTPHLAMWARVEGFETADLDAALCEDRSLWRLHAMRRTLFVIPTDEARHVLVAASADIAAKERRRLEGWLEAEMSARKLRPWLKQAQADVHRVLAEGDELLTQELSDRIPALARAITVGSGKWSRPSPVSSRLLFLMAMDGELVRTRPAGTWRSSQYRWARADAWFGDARPSPALDPAQARAALLLRYLHAHGPATLTDIRWWTGWTAKHTQAGLKAIGAITVALEGGDEGWILPGDLEADTKTREAVVALLPSLDPTPMGWKQRAWFLGPHEAALFDRNGNIGPTIWWQGRIVGGWAVRSDGEVAIRLLEDVGARATRTIKAEAKALGAWLDGTTVIPRFRTPLERELAGAE